MARRHPAARRDHPRPGTRRRPLHGPRGAACAGRRRAGAAAAGRGRLRHRDRAAEDWPTRLRRAAVTDVYEVRAAVEVHAARLAAHRRTPDDITAMERALAGRWPPPTRTTRPSSTPTSPSTRPWSPPRTTPCWPTCSASSPRPARRPHRPADPDHPAHRGPRDGPRRPRGPAAGGGAGGRGGGGADPGGRAGGPVRRGPGVAGRTSSPVRPACGIPRAPPGLSPTRKMHVQATWKGPA